MRSISGIGMGRSNTQIREYHILFTDGTLFNVKVFLSLCILFIHCSFVSQILIDLIYFSPLKFFWSLHPAWSLFLNCSYFLGDLSLSVLIKCVLIKKSVLLTRNLPFDSSDVRRWRHPLMIPLHCLWANSNNRMCSQFECDVTCFCYDLVRSHALRGCCSYVFKLCKKNTGWLQNE